MVVTEGDEGGGSVTGLCTGLAGGVLDCSMFFELEEAEYRESTVHEEKLHRNSCFKTMHPVKVY